MFNKTSRRILLTGLMALEIPAAGFAQSHMACDPDTCNTHILGDPAAGVAQSHMVCDPVECNTGVLGIPATRFAQPHAAGLGQAWPNAPDVSANSSWHVYVFLLNGIRFIQVNDINGNVLGAVGTANGQFIVLPMGIFAQYVLTPQQPGTAVPDNSSQASSVYQDGSVMNNATSMSNGVAQLTASAALCDPEDCSGRYALAPQKPGAAVPDNSSQVSSVYQDRSVMANATSMSNGVAQLTASAAPCQDPENCGAQSALTPQQPGVALLNNSSKASLVYEDLSVMITATPMSNGVTQLTATAAPCQNPEDCGQHSN